MSGIAFLAARDGSPKTDYHEWFNDFDFYLATDWVITEQGSGTRAIAQTKGGVLVVTNAAADNDSNNLQLRDVASGQVAEHWKWVSGKKLYFGARFKVADMTQSDWVFGLQITGTEPIDAALTDGIWFRKNDGDADLDFVVSKDSATTGTKTALKVLSNDTYYVMEFYYDGTSDYIQAFVDGVNVGNVSVDYAPDNEELTLSFALQNGTDAAGVLSIDWVRIIQER